MFILFTTMIQYRKLEKVNSLRLVGVPSTFSRLVTPSMCLAIWRTYLHFFIAFSVTNSKYSGSKIVLLQKFFISKCSGHFSFCEKFIFLDLFSFLLNSKTQFLHFIGFCVFKNALPVFFYEFRPNHRKI